MKIIARHEGDYRNWDIVRNDNNASVGCLKRGPGNAWLGFPQRPGHFEQDIQAFATKFNSGLLLPGLSLHGVCTLCSRELSGPAEVLVNGRFRCTECGQSLSLGKPEEV
jgi:hypothetical protein